MLLIVSSDHTCLYIKPLFYYKAQHNPHRILHFVITRLPGLSHIYHIYICMYLCVYILMGYWCWSSCYRWTRINQLPSYNKNNFFATMYLQISIFPLTNYNKISFIAIMYQQVFIFPLTSCNKHQFFCHNVSQASMILLTSSNSISFVATKYQRESIFPLTSCDMIVLFPQYINKHPCLPLTSCNSISFVVTNSPRINKNPCFHLIVLAVTKVYFLLPMNRDEATLFLQQINFVSTMNYQTHTQRERENWSTGLLHKTERERSDLPLFSIKLRKPDWSA